jgi:hypothetical protein
LGREQKIGSQTKGSDFLAYFLPWWADLRWALVFLPFTLFVSALLLLGALASGDSVPSDYAFAGIALGFAQEWYLKRKAKRSSRDWHERHRT